MSFFSRLNYSLGNEDWITEKKALDIAPDSTVLCITASGDRPLHILSTPCEKVISIDANVIQNHLFQLKLGAINGLDYGDYLDFLGLQQSGNRPQIFEYLKDHLPEDTYRFWSRRKRKLDRGIIYEGFIERLCGFASGFLDKVRGEKINTLFSFDDLEKQKEFVNEHWDTQLFRKTFQVLLHPFLTRLFVRDPGLYNYLGKNMHVGKYLYDRLHQYLNNGLAKESMLLSLVFKGQLIQDSYPPYLKKETYQSIRDASKDKLHIETIDILSYLKKAEDNSIDRFSFSDVASYISQEMLNELLHHTVRTAKNNARFCLRQFLSDHEIPKELEHHFIRDHDLEKELQEKDKCILYRFMVGTIKK